MIPLAPRQTALYWLAQGIVPIPLRWGSKRHVLLDWLPYQYTQPEAWRVVAWFDRPRLNVGLVCGPVSGNLAVLDFDGGPLAYAAWCAAQPVRQQTYTVKTARGVHAYFFLDTWPEAYALAKGVDVKLSGLVLAAGSRHPSGILYQVWRAVPIARVAGLEELLPGLTLTARTRSLESEGSDEQVARWPLRAELDGQGVVWRLKRFVSPAWLVRTYWHWPLVTDDEQWFHGSCPLHRPDVHPSFWLHDPTGRWGCFSRRCPGHRGGDVIDLYALQAQVSRETALDELSVILNRDIWHLGG